MKTVVHSLIANVGTCVAVCCVFRTHLLLFSFSFLLKVDISPLIQQLSGNFARLPVKFKAGLV